MKLLREKRCYVGEGPIWNDEEQNLYFTNSGENEICSYNLKTKEIKVRPLSFNVSALAFDVNNRLIVSCEGGVHVLNDDDSYTAIYDTKKYKIEYANDMKVGPDGAIYVGTISRKVKGIANNVDGKLYRISPNGDVDVLLDNLGLSNGMEWSIDETKFYHTDSSTHVVKEYNFDKFTGKIAFTGREVKVYGVDGFTIDIDCNLYLACWRNACIAVVDTKTFEVVKRISLPCKIPASCSFCGGKMNILAITTASMSIDIMQHKNEGFTILRKMNAIGRKPYRYLNNKILLK